MKLYKLNNEKYFLTYWALINLKTLLRVEWIKLDKAEMVEANKREIKKIDNYLEMRAIEFENSMED